MRRPQMADSPRLASSLLDELLDDYASRTEASAAPLRTFVPPPPPPPRINSELFWLAESEHAQRETAEQVLGGQPDSREVRVDELTLDRVVELRRGDRRYIYTMLERDYQALGLRLDQTAEAALASVDGCCCICGLPRTECWWNAKKPENQ